MRAQDGPASLSALAAAGPRGALRWLVARWGADARRGTLLRTGGLVGLALVVGAMLLPPPGPQTVGDVTRHGGALLEVAFVLGLLLGAFLLFAALDVLMRSRWRMVVVLGPVNGAFVAAERMRALAGLGLACALPGAALFLPLAGSIEGAVSLLYILLAVAVALGVGLGTMMVSARAMLNPRGAGARGAGAMTGDAAAGVWSVAPGIGFALLAVLLLILRFGADELARAAADPALPAVTRAAQVTLGLPLAVAFLLGLRGYGILRLYFARISARFMDGEVRGAPAGAGPWFEDRTEPAGWMTGRWGRRAAMLVHKDRLQLARAHPFRRLALPALALLLVLVRWASPTALPVYGVVGLLLLVQVLVLRPWLTLRTLEVHGGGMARLLAEPAERERAARRAVAVELGGHAFVAFGVLLLWVVGTDAAGLLAVIPAAWLGQVVLPGRVSGVAGGDERYGALLGALAGGVLGAVLGGPVALLVVGVGVAAALTGILRKGQGETT